jgi:hypothetical protein
LKSRGQDGAFGTKGKSLAQKLAFVLCTSFLLGFLNKLEIAEVAALRAGFDRVPDLRKFF